MQAQKRLVVVGGGISGLAAVDAALSSTHAPDEVVLVNDGARIGGHACVASLPSCERVDLGFMVYNDATYPNLLELYEKYDVQSMATDMSFAVDTGGKCWSFQSTRKWLLLYALRPSTWQFVREHAVFRRAAIRLLERATGTTTLGAFWSELPRSFVTGWLQPFVRAVWSVAQEGDVAEFPAEPTLRFMNNHGFLDDWSKMLAWRTPKNRSGVLCDAIVEKWSQLGKLRVVDCKARACSLQHVELDDGRVLKADMIILATHAPTQRELLKAGGLVERAAILHGARVSRWTATLHRDTNLMPKKQYDWSSWNVLPDGRLTYWLSRLQHLKDNSVFLTLESAAVKSDKASQNRPRDVVLRVDFDHPVLTPAMTLASRALRMAARGTSLVHAGAWLGHGFHEDGILSARRAVREVLGDSSLTAARPDARTPLSPSRVVAYLTHVDSSGIAFSSTFPLLRFEASHAPPGLVVQADHPGLIEASARKTTIARLEPVSSIRAPLSNAAIRIAFHRETGVYPDGRIDVIAAPRALPFLAAFNPLTWCIIYDDFNEATVIGHLVEVHNTPYGEATIYGWLGETHRVAKKLHVSPGHQVPSAADPATAYDFAVSLDSSTLTVRLVDEHSDRRVIFSTLMRVVSDNNNVVDAWRRRFAAPSAFLEVYARMFFRIIVTRRRKFHSYVPKQAQIEMPHGQQMTARVSLAALFATTAILIVNPSRWGIGLVALWAMATFSTVGCEWRLDRLVVAEACLLAALLTHAQYARIFLHVLSATCALSRSTRVAVDAALLLSSHDLDDVLVKWTQIWLCARLALVAWHEHCAGFASARRVGYRHDFDIDVQRRAMMELGMIHAMIMTIFAALHWQKIFTLSTLVPFNDTAVASFNDIFRGYMAHDFIAGLVLGPHERPALQYTMVIFIHHALFWLASNVNAIYKVYSHEFVYLVIGELSTIFLYLNAMFKSNATIFLTFVATFGMTRVVLLSLAFGISLYYRFPLYLKAATQGDVPHAVVWLTPATTVLALVGNGHWFRSLWKKCWGRVLPRVASRVVEDYLSRRGHAGRVDIVRAARAFSLILRRGDVGLGEGYVEEAWTTKNTDDLARVLGVAARAYGELTDQSTTIGFMCTRAVKARFSFDTAVGRQASIAAHYDQNAELFRHMLGNTMVYTSALYGKGRTNTRTMDGEVLDLDEAQRRKVARVLELGRAEPGKRLLDLGCGYGELVREAASRGLDAVGLTNSILMQRGATDRLGGLGRVVLGDMLVPPPNLGVFDIVTCVEAIEALHHNQYAAFARTVRECLDPGGCAVFQIIHGYGSRNPSIRQKEHRPPSTFVQTYIFPDQQLPYLEHVYDEFRAAGLRCVYSESTGADYAKTLRAWRHNIDAMPTMSAPRPTRRIFEFYLAWYVNVTIAFSQRAIAGVRPASTQDFSMCRVAFLRSCSDLCRISVLPRVPAPLVGLQHTRCTRDPLHVIVQHERLRSRLDDKLIFSGGIK